MPKVKQQDRRNSREMALAVYTYAYVLSVAAFVFLSPAATSAQEEEGEGQGTCRACHCQFNNVEVLQQLIESTIRNILVNDTGSTRAVEERVINTLNTDSSSTQTLETRIANAVETNQGKLRTVLSPFSIHVAAPTPPLPQCLHYPHFFDIRLIRSAKPYPPTMP